MPLTPEEKGYLFDLYSDPARVGSLTGIGSLARAIKKEGRYNISNADLLKWLQKNQTYTLHRPFIRKFPREEIVVSGPNVEWDIDLADMTQLVKFNNGHNYFLVVIDDFSKFVHTKPLETKNGKEVTAAMKEILESVSTPPEIIRCDQGTEFSNATFKKLLTDNNIKLVLTQNELKASIAERCIKTLKNRLYRYFTETDDLNWVGILSDITKSYNNSYHRSIKMAPKDVNVNNQDQVWENLHKLKPWKENVPFKFEINDKVRLTGIRKPFEREYDMKWTVEIFIVCDRFYKGQIHKYKLKDYDNEEIEGSFYEKELQKVLVDDDTIFRIEKVVGRRTRRGRRELLVKWWKWPSKFNSYIPASQYRDYVDLRRQNRTR